MAPFQERAHTGEKLLGVEPKSSRVSETERKETKGPETNGEGEEARKSQKASCHLLEHYTETEERAL